MAIRRLPSATADARARLALFRVLAGHFRSLVEFPDKAVENRTDEQNVRCVLRVIYGVRQVAGRPSRPSP
jgi:hypothetical protein